MKIDWLGHCCFRLTESTGTTIVTDPFDPEQLGCNLPEVGADAVTCSHLHPIHSHIEGIKGNPMVINSVGAYDVKGVHIESILSQRTDGSANLVHRYRMDGVDICHLGDIGTPITPELVEEIAPIDVLILPVAGHNRTIDAETALEYVDLLMPEVVIPMHYDMNECDNDYDFDSVKDFVRLFDDENVIEQDEYKSFEFERDDFDNKGTRVLVPQRMTE